MGSMYFSSMLERQLKKKGCDSFPYPINIFYFVQMHVC